jgi:hypothetical protein
MVTVMVMVTVMLTRITSKRMASRWEKNGAGADILSPEGW